MEYFLSSSLITILGFLVRKRVEIGLLMFRGSDFLEPGVSSIVVSELINWD